MKKENFKWIVLNEYKHFNYETYDLHLIYNNITVAIIKNISNMNVIDTECLNLIFDSFDNKSFSPCLYYNNLCYTNWKYNVKKTNFIDIKKTKQFVKRKVLKSNIIIKLQDLKNRLNINLL